MSECVLVRIRLCNGDLVELLPKSALRVTVGVPADQLLSRTLGTVELFTSEDVLARIERHDGVVVELLRDHRLRVSVPLDQEVLKHILDVTEPRPSSAHPTDLAFLNELLPGVEMVGEDGVLLGTVELFTREDVLARIEHDSGFVVELLPDHRLRATKLGRDPLLSNLLPVAVEDDDYTVQLQPRQFKVLVDLTDPDYENSLKKCLERHPGRSSTPPTPRQLTSFASRLSESLPFSLLRQADASDDYELVGKVTFIRRLSPTDETEAAIEASMPCVIDLVRTGQIATADKIIERLVEVDELAGQWIKRNAVAKAVLHIATSSRKKITKDIDTVFRRQGRLQRDGLVFIKA